MSSSMDNSKSVLNRREPPMRVLLLGDSIRMGCSAVVLLPQNADLRKRVRLGSIQSRVWVRYAHLESPRRRVIHSSAENREET